MKKIIIVLCILMPTCLSGQFLDPYHFNEEKMNNVLFMKMNEFTVANYSYSLFRTSQGDRRIYRLIRKNCEKMDLDDLTLELNNHLKKRYDNELLVEANLVGSVGLTCSMTCKGIKSYQGIVDLCIGDWSTSENLIFMKWGQICSAISYYDRRTDMVHLFFGFYY